MIEWIILFALNSLFWKWIISWGGAEKVEGWKSFFLINSFATHWNAKQIKFYGMVTWFLTVLWFIAGIFIPELRV